MTKVSIYYQDKSLFACMAAVICMLNYVYTHTVKYVVCDGVPKLNLDDANIIVVVGLDIPYWMYCFCKNSMKKRVIVIGKGSVPRRALPGIAVNAFPNAANHVVDYLLKAKYLKHWFYRIVEMDPHKIVRVVTSLTVDDIKRDFEWFSGVRKTYEFVDNISFGTIGDLRAGFMETNTSTHGIRSMALEKHNIDIIVCWWYNLESNRIHAYTKARNEGIIEALDRLIQATPCVSVHRRKGIKTDLSFPAPFSNFFTITKQGEYVGGFNIMSHVAIHTKRVILRRTDEKEKEIQIVPYSALSTEPVEETFIWHYLPHEFVSDDREGIILCGRKENIVCSYVDGIFVEV